MLTPVGKTVGVNTYIHYSARESVPPEMEERIRFAESQVNAVPGQTYNVIRYSQKKNNISLLLYDDFFVEPFPVLNASCLVNLDTGSISRRDYSGYVNPPILHRKELLLDPDHPSVSEFRALTQLLEDGGLFQESTRIGTKNKWEERLRSAGFEWVLNGSSVDQKLSINREADEQVVRHRTAISRHTFSRSFQCLERYGYLTNEYDVFDYGCGKGDDLRGLSELGIESSGWDPHFRPDGKINNADIVNLGYVINVIETREERIETIQKAYSLTKVLLVVSAQLERERNPEHRAYKDGVLTSRNTFQKYYAHSQLEEFVYQCTEEKPIAVGPGIFFVFRDKLAEQTFLSKRQRSRVSTRPRFLIPRPTETEKQAELYQQHKEILDELWRNWLTLGRTPYADEIDEISPKVIESFGSIKRALRFLVQLNGEEKILEASKSRTDDLLVYFALNLFHGRPRYSRQPLRLQRDVKLLLRNHTTALDQARQLLFSVSEPDVVLQSCKEAAEQGIGCLDDKPTLTLHSSLINDLPAELRVYIGCASQLYGDIENTDLIKVHVNSGKLTVMVFDDFDSEPLPKMTERIKIKLRDQDIDYFDYGLNYAPPYLYWKSKYMDSSFPRYKEQVEFDQQLRSHNILEDGNERLPVVEFNRELRDRNLIVEDFQIKLRDIPEDLSQRCGKYLSYQDLIECGETRANLMLENRPTQLDTFSALNNLANEVLDPVIDYFGMIKLTYGFCSLELSRKIERGIAPSLDQHSSCELNKKGKPICKRLGAAVDFLVEDEDMYEVAVWLIENTEFDRLYFYGKDRPIHVSTGPENSRSIVMLTISATGRQIPKTVSGERFLKWNC